MNVEEINLSEMLFNRDERLLDYITNLQKENKELRNRVNDLLVDDTEYKLENERLNLELSGYRQAILNDDNLMGLKERIDKAIEYIKEHNCIATNKEYKPTQFEYCCSFDLLNILKGEE